MSDDIPKEVKIAKSLGLDQVAPDIYKDLMQPAAKELGMALEVTAKAVSLALLPIEGLVWGADKIKEHLNSSLTNRLKDIPTEQIVSPNPSVVGPAIEALKFSGHNPDLRELFENLIESSIRATTSDRTHPAFVEMIKQISSDEAKMLLGFANAHAYPLIDYSNTTIDIWREEQNEELLRSLVRNCSDLNLDKPELIPSYVDNLRRLKVIEITHEYKDDMKSRLESYSVDLDNLEYILSAEKERVDELIFTSLGQQFIEICVKPK